MNISKLEFKNINSYGNNLQEITFDDDGGLVLILGKNGSGKSTIKSTLELCIFGKVQGKSGKRLALTKLPNRRNLSLYAGVYFKNHNDDNIIMKRFIQPNNFEMFFNDEPFTQRFKIITEKEREKIIGYSFEIFKSFISLNMNDFKNFISLSKEDKENLLNKLFNLNELDILYSIVKDLDSNNQKLINEIDNLIYNNDQTISEYRQTIQNVKNTKEISREEKLKQLKQSILDKKPTYTDLEEKIKNCDDERNVSNSKLSKLNTLKTNKQLEKTKLQVEIESLQEKIEQYNTGICPICNTDLTDGKHVEHLHEMLEKVSIKEKLIIECNTYLNRCILEDSKIKNNNERIYKEKSKYQNELSILKSELAILNNEYKILLNTTSDNTIDMLENKIIDLKNINKQKNDILLDLNKKSRNYDELKKIFSVDGIRTSMIKNALIPINEYLTDFLKLLKSEYNATLDENFDAKILELNVLDIDSETLSKGEDKKINIAIALSYLKFILTMKHSNIMFLDEIFDGVDPNNIILMLNVLKTIAKEYKINIMIVHHNIEQIADIKIFDKIIKVEKDIFSNIEIIKN